MSREHEERFLLASSPSNISPHPFGTDIANVGGRDKTANKRGLLLTLFIAFGIFGVATGTARYLFPRGSGSRHPTSDGLQQQTGLVRLGGSPTTDECTASASGPVINGADVVAYFALEEFEPAVDGSEEHQATYNGYTFWFASEENKAVFEEDPLRYVPAWGGFCGWGISREGWWYPDTLGPEADPNIWLITEEGKLIFFRSMLPRKYFMGAYEGVTGTIRGNIRAGDERWHSWWGDAEPGVGADSSPLNTNCYCSVEICADG